MNDVYNILNDNEIVLNRICCLKNVLWILIRINIVSKRPIKTNIVRNTKIKYLYITNDI